MSGDHAPRTRTKSQLDNGDSETVSPKEYRLNKVEVVPLNDKLH